MVLFPSRRRHFYGCGACDTDELFRRDSPARTSNDEITLYKAVGTALADLAAATMVYEAALIAG
ncbi:hypothetical protein BAE36_30530 [Rhizobium leguminosarum bv. trifolii]|jgi:ornithine cyclodeaminase/alanine dehydrogenase-like protein (mu-crystallin family)|uniref:Ornithine cyclodeaminase n=1 Tax=Rhizobium leguminosarum bv. trifolii TaxID=386 RepID=A0A1B8R4J3_RHILT|nr:ornithine cyclodeaminase [Rhizobium leguminosarum bv. trifolii]OBY03698.1 hypothetical protein BAE36_30530 [Rhizobium leguminosarum bv. trifolii]